MGLFSTIARAYRAWRYVEEDPDPEPADEKKLERFRERLVEIRRSAARLRQFHMHCEADLKDREAADHLKEIDRLQMRLRRPAA